ncbi:MAG TPA: TM2 domain-containing protein [Edaphocola sp.]|nr:TM2 domain-containing protein [Edaphocola sp.]
MGTKKLFLSIFLVFTSLAVFAAFPMQNSEVITQGEYTTLVANEEYSNLDGNMIASETTSKVSDENVMAKVSAAAANAGGKSQIVALILCLLVGTLGIHRFYLGYTWQGVVQLLTLGGFGIWVLIDLIRIIIGDLQPKDGQYDQTL